MKNKLKIKTTETTNIKSILKEILYDDNPYKEKFTKIYKYTNN
jgi:hypothetical protein